MVRLKQTALILASMCWTALALDVQGLDQNTTSTSVAATSPPLLSPTTLAAENDKAGNSTSAVPTTVVPFQPTFDNSKGPLSLGYPSSYSLTVTAGMMIVCCGVGFMKRRQVAERYANFRQRRLAQRRYALEDSFLEDGQKEWKCNICLHENHPRKEHCLMCHISKEQSDEIEQAKSKLTASISGDRFQWRSFSRDRRNIMRKQTIAPEFTLTQRQRVARRRKHWVKIQGTESSSWRWLEVTDSLESKEGTPEAVNETLVPNNSQEIEVVIDSFVDSINKDEKNQNVVPLLAASGIQMIRDDVYFTDRLSIRHGPAFFSMINWKTEELNWVSTDTSITHEGIPEVDVFRYNVYEDIARWKFSAKTKWLLRQLMKIGMIYNQGYVDIEVDRHNILTDSINLLELPPDLWRQRLRVKFKDELGFDAGGLLREWTYLMCNALFSSTLGLFQPAASESGGYWIDSMSGEKNKDHLKLFRFTGRLMAKALLENQLLTANLAVPLLKHILGSPMVMDDIEYVDEELHKGLSWLHNNSGVECLGLDFTATTTDGKGKIEIIELKADGRNVEVNDENKGEYIELMTKYKLFDSVKPQLYELLHGMKEVAPEILLLPFDYLELELLFCGTPTIDVNDWKGHTELHYVTPELPTVDELQNVDWFWSVLRSFPEEQKCKLLQFTTGCSRAPVEGFKALTSHDGKVKQFNIHFFSVEEDAPSFMKFPRAHTCFNRLDFPVYKSEAELKSFLLKVLEADVAGFTMM